MPGIMIMMRDGPRSRRPSLVCFKFTVTATTVRVWLLTQSDRRADPSRRMAQGSAHLAARRDQCQCVGAGSCGMPMRPRPTHAAAAGTDQLKKLEPCRALRCHGGSGTDRSPAPLTRRAIRRNT
jgi:hypothetical protein